MNKINVSILSLRVPPLPKGLIFLADVVLQTNFWSIFEYKVDLSVRPCCPNAVHLILWVASFKRVSRMVMWLHRYDCNVMLGIVHESRSADGIVGYSDVVVREPDRKGEKKIRKHVHS